eukprot:TRINITY_DN10682_c0_g1_i1.p1 TRINITY_DN10682_c0_g1~~TRINITY_DN10682_c0_g1_i1.p1  ORF type:complete len:375 (-),score=54.90 TRINITY_DN10682_c0_g1_i1:795-1799(-)
MTTADVIVVGGGLSGLQACKSLGNCGLKVICVEGRDRVGGRTEAFDFQDWNIDLGGAYIGPTQHRLRRLAEEHNVQMKTVFAHGKRMVESGNKIHTYSGVVPYSMSIPALLDLDHMQRSLEVMAREVPVEAPWNAKNAKEWDGITAAAWRDSCLYTSACRNVFDIALRTLLCCEPSEVSLLYFLWYTHSAGGMDELIKDEGGAQEKTFIGGSMQLSVKMAAALPSNVQLLLSSPVQCITQDAKRVQVTLQSGKKVTASRIILAMSPPMIGKLQIEPRLSVNRQQLAQRMIMGCIFKTFVIYARPWWRELGYAGVVISNVGPGAFRLGGTENSTC